MGLLSCCLWWFLLGLLLGWVLNWLLSKWFARAPRTAKREAPHAAEKTAGAGLDARAPSHAPAPEVAPSGAERHGAVSSSRLIDVGAARAAGFNLKHSDDLTIIEGIGPKIDDLLKHNGVGSFVELAQTSVDDILEILDRGGSHFKLANPDSWAEQASLAAENRWADLKALQDELVGGIDRPGDR